MSNISLAPEQELSIVLLLQMISSNCCDLKIYYVVSLKQIFNVRSYVFALFSITLEVCYAYTYGGFL